jgi:hypothetical protein
VTKKSATEKTNGVVERFWSGQQDMNTATVEDYKELIATAARAVSQGEARAADAATNAAVAKERIERIKAGENVTGGLGKRVDYVAILRKAGFTDQDMEECRQVFAISTYGDAAWERYRSEGNKDRERAERATTRRVLRELKKSNPLR